MAYGAPPVDDRYRVATYAHEADEARDAADLVDPSDFWDAINHRVTSRPLRSERRR